jgi:hypothetical protein
MYLWDESVNFSDSDVDSFFEEHFSHADRNVLFICGAGFDPRATIAAHKLSSTLGTKINCILLKEERPDPDPELVLRANFNLDHLKDKCNVSAVHSVDIFSEDNAVVGGIHVIKTISYLRFDTYTDIVVDLSALSIGISFPIVKFIYDTVTKSKIKTNVHLIAVSLKSVVSREGGSMVMLKKPNYGYLNFPVDESKL